MRACLQNCVRAVATTMYSPAQVDAVMDSLRQEMTTQQQAEGCGSTGALRSSITTCARCCRAQHGRRHEMVAALVLGTPLALVPLPCASCHVGCMRTCSCLPAAPPPVYAEDMLEPEQRKLRQQLYKINHSLRRGGIGPPEGERWGRGRTTAC